MKEKLLFICEACSGGVGRHLNDIIGELDKDKFEIHLTINTLNAYPNFITSVTKHAVTCNMQMKNMPELRDIKNIIFLYHYIKQHGPFKIIHGHSFKGGFLARLVGMLLKLTGKAANCKLLYTPHAFFSMGKNSKFSIKLFNFIEKSLAYFTDVLICVSEEERQHALSMGIAAHKLQVINNGLKLTPAAEVELNRANLRNKYNLSANQLCLGFIGRLEKQKDPLLFIELLNLLKAKKLKFTALMIGYGRLKSAVEHAIKKYALNDNIIFISDSNIPAAPLVFGFDLLISTSIFEGMPYVFLEAIDAGVPIISRPVGGTAHLVKENITGFLVKNIDEAAKKISFLAENREILQQTRKECLDYKKNIALAEMMHQLTTLYSKV
jgi:glycosyltransferase involved in cell wall biosynthesis